MSEILSDLLDELEDAASEWGRKPSGVSASRVTTARVMILAAAARLSSECEDLRAELEPAREVCKAASLDSTWRGAFDREIPAHGYMAAKLDLWRAIHLGTRHPLRWGGESPVEADWLLAAASPSPEGTE